MASATTTKVTSTNGSPLKTRSPKDAPVATPEERQTQEAFVSKQLEQDRIALLRAEQKRIAAELKELRASQPNKLEREIARQLAQPNGDLVLTLRASLRGRMLYGQSFEDAIAGVVEQCRSILEATPEDERIRKMPTPPFTKKAKAE